MTVFRRLLNSLLSSVINTKLKHKEPIMATNKTQTWNEVQALLEAHQTKEKPSKKEIVLREALEVLLAPKTSGGSANPPQEIDGVMNYYCRFHQTYEPLEDMVMSKGNSKGYCKASISKWNKTNANIKKLDAQVQALVTDGNFEEAQAIAQESKGLKDGLNNPENYDIVEDWNAFAPVTEDSE